ncbi:MAG: hypothetical protein HYV68_00680 [Candidatus Taylorbacteria bacterium]|nr:hypothetical protein [Candidatus Taylorbacteria bacterium]
MLILIYKIALVLTAFGAAFVALDLFIKKEGRTKFELLFGLMSVAFVIWAAGRFVLLTATDHDVALFWAHVLYNGSILVHILFLHTIMLFLNVDKTAFHRYILALFYGLGLSLLIINNLYFITGQSYLISDVVPKLSFAFYEVPDQFYFLHLLNYIFIPTYSFFLMVAAIRRGGATAQIQAVMFASLVGFIGGNSVVPLVYDIQFEPLLIVILPFYMPILTYAIVKHQLFNIRVIGTEVFMLTLWFIIIIRTFASDDLNDQLFNFAFLLITVVIGIFLIRSHMREVEHRLKTEKMAMDLEFANAKFAELDQLKSEFVSLASHQLRGPLTAIKGYASEIIEGDFGKVPKYLVEPINTIYRSCQSLVIIVEDFLNVSRIEQGRMRYDYTEFSLGELAEEVMTENKPSFERKRLNTYVAVDKGPKVRADRGKIKQIIGNLVDNSIKYTQQGEVTVGVAQVGKKVVFSIKDTGVGIGKDTMPRLFQKFYRAADASRANILGTGLGLYVASQMIKAHGGRIWAESGGDNKGTAFFVELDVV